jgi:hypothetical protein
MEFLASHKKNHYIIGVQIFKTNSIAKNYTQKKLLAKKA